ncbi:hypothetical protein N7540_012287 [Penicillium herquei]|nr:hypothetical protein N7540_012287 [Penicillium herquei]
MHFSNLKSLTLLVLYQTATGAAKCGDADACIGTEICTTATFTTPVQTTITTCVPTPTCLGVYALIIFQLNATSAIPLAIAAPATALQPCADPPISNGQDVKRTAVHALLLRIVATGTNVSTGFARNRDLWQW